MKARLFVKGRAKVCTFVWRQVVGEGPCPRSLPVKVPLSKMSNGKWLRCAKASASESERRADGLIHWQVFQLLWKNRGSFDSSACDERHYYPRKHTHRVENNLRAATKAKLAMARRGAFIPREVREPTPAGVPPCTPLPSVIWNMASLPC